ncbi:hypothetical protein [Kitasatospora sp. NPDC056181]|uniref:hypothetical protein n=1 Tax=Kitasatospora sp. NPDC056181 TaxID=3345737 RepID=UPI0035D8AC3B
MGTGDAVVAASTQEDAWALRRAGARLRTELRDPARGGALVPEALPVLIRMLRAPSGRSRRDALRLLAELAERPAAYWWPIWDRGGRALLAPVVPEVARLAGDADRKVRGLVPPLLRALGAPRLGGPELGAPRFDGLIGEALAGDSVERLALIDALPGAAAGAHGPWSLDIAERAVVDRRAPLAELYALVANCLDHPSWQVRERALRLITEAGSAAAPYADRLAVSMRPGSLPYEGGREALALAHLGDRRVPDFLRERFRTALCNVALGRLLGTYGAEAATLLPVVRAAASLQNAVVSAAALEALAGWGPAAAPAVPELTGALDSAEARRAAAALGAVGPAADRAAPRLRELAEGVGVPAVTPGPRDPRALPWHGAQTAAWAHWRITGEHRLALRVLGEAVEAGPGRPHLRYLADLGPLASRHAEAVRALLDHPGDWTRVEAAHAWWRLTGEPGPAVEVLAGELASARPTDELPAVLRYLTGIGGPAAAAAPVLEAYLSGHRRQLGGTPLTPRQDELLTAAAAGALAAIRTG